MTSGITGIIYYINIFPRKINSKNHNIVLFMAVGCGDKATNKMWQQEGRRKRNGGTAQLLCTVKMKVQKAPKG